MFRVFLIAIVLVGCSTSEPVDQNTDGSNGQIYFKEVELGAITQRVELSHDLKGRITGHIWHDTGESALKGYGIKGPQGTSLSRHDEVFEITLPEGEHEIMFYDTGMDTIRVTFDFVGGIEREVVIHVDGGTDFEPKE